MDQKLKTLTRENERLVTENNKWLEGSKATFDMKVKELAVLNADKGRETVLGAVKQVPVVSSAMCKYDVTSESKLKEDCSEITVTSESESKTNMTGKSDVSKTAVRIEFEEHVGKQGDDECVGDAVLFRNKVSSEALESDSGKYPYTSGLEKPEAVDLKANAPDEKIERHTDIPINLDGETRNRGLQNKATYVSNSALESWMQTTKVRLKKFKNTTSVGKDDLGRSDISG